MPLIDDVLERLRTDATFRDEVVRDPKTSLEAYDLSPDELSELTEHLAADHEALDPVEQRTAKAGLFALFTNAMQHGGGRVRVAGATRISAPGGGDAPAVDAPVVDAGGDAASPPEPAG